MGSIISNKKAGFLKYLLLLVLFCFISAFYLLITLTQPYQSDHASILLEAKSIIDGNFLLNGWTLSTVSYYTTEIPFYIIGLLLFGLSEKVIYLVTAFNYALLTLTIVYLCSASDDGRVSVGKLLISCSFSFFIAALLSHWQLLSPVHVVGYTYCLFSIFLLKRFEKTKSLVSLSVYFLILVITFVGDTSTIYVWGIPILIIMIYKLFIEEHKSKFALLLATTFISIVISKAILALIELNGGFFIPGVVSELKFVDYASIGNNLYLFFIGLFDLFSVVFFGQPVFSILSLLSLVHLLGLIVFILAIYWSIKNYKKLSLINQIILVAILINLIEYLLGNVAVSRVTVRYLLPALIFSIILITNFIDEIILRRFNHIYIIAICLLIGLSLIPPMSISRPTLPITNLNSFLADMHLENGYGPYWTGSITTVHSGGKVSIRPVVSTDNKFIKPFYWLAEESWYTGNSTFLVIDSDESYNVSENTATKTFGKPDKTYHVDGYTVLVWNKNISPYLFGN